MGVGTSTPARSLHVARDDSSAKVLVENTNAGSGPQTMFELMNNGPTRFTLSNTNADTWNMNAANDGYRINAVGVPFVIARFDTAGDLFLAGTIQATSDRDRKEAFAEVDPEEILDKIANLPVTSWRYKEGDTEARHLGPTGQDFFAAFGLGTDERHISPTDTAGVALAAIKALDARLRELGAEVEDLRLENASLKALIGNDVGEPDDSASDAQRH